MGMALGLIAITLVGTAGEPRSSGEKVQIQYTVNFLETEGVGWREAVLPRLTPVTRQGAATIWSAPGNIKGRVLKQAIPDRNAHPVQTTVFRSLSGTPAHFQVRSDRQLVTQVVWDGNDQPEPSKPESVRTGPVGTMLGRKLDQGILVQIVLEDTQIRSVHRVKVNGPTDQTQSVTARSPAQFRIFVGQGKAAGLSAFAYQIPSLKPGVGNLPTLQTIPATDKACQEGTKLAPQCQTTAVIANETIHGALNKLVPHVLPNNGVIQVHLETANSESSCCESSFNGTKTACLKTEDSDPVSIEVPEIATQEIAGEWLIPKDGVLLVSFGPYTVAGQDGKAAVRERLAILEAAVAEIGGVDRASTTDPRATSAAAAAPLPLPAPVVTGKAPAIFPALPSRSIPRGVHADGTPSVLPPLPDEDSDEVSSEESAEPRPSSQTKKPHPSPSKPVPLPGPATDTQMKRTGYGSNSILPSMPTVFLTANPTVGLQFLMPIKAVSLKLPFDRKLEIEIFGRIVRQPEPAEIPAEIVVKPKGSELR